LLAWESFSKNGEPGNQVKDEGNNPHINHGHPLALLLGTVLAVAIIGDDLTEGCEMNAAVLTFGKGRDGHSFMTPNSNE
jgi:hypothetical protein